MHHQFTPNSTIRRSRMVCAAVIYCHSVDCSHNYSTISHDSLFSLFSALPLSVCNFYLPFSTKSTTLMHRQQQPALTLPQQHWVFSLICCAESDLSLVSAGTNRLTLRVWLIKKRFLARCWFQHSRVVITIVIITITHFRTKDDGRCFFCVEAFSAYLFFFVGWNKKLLMMS